MGCCLSREQTPRNHLIPDVEQILADDAWEEFMEVNKRRYKCRRLLMRRSDYTIEVPMNYFLFQESAPKVDPLDRLQTLNHAANKTHTTAGSQLKDKQLPHHDKAGSENNRLETKFRNDTDQDQTYTFRFEKTRHASVNVSYQKGFSFGGKANFTLDLVQAGLELEARYEVTKSTGESFEESMTSEATSDIKVSHNSECTATVEMKERHLSTKFSLDVFMSMPEGEALVFIKNSAGRVVFVKQIQNIAVFFPVENRLPPKNRNPQRRPTMEDPLYAICCFPVRRKSIYVTSQGETNEGVEQENGGEGEGNREGEEEYGGEGGDKEGEDKEVGDKRGERGREAGQRKSKVQSHVDELKFDLTKEYDPKMVKFEVKGIIEGTLLSTHHIHLKSQGIAKEPVENATQTNEHQESDDDDIPEEIDYQTSNNGNVSPQVDD